jgi:protein gp37
MGQTTGISWSKSTFSPWLGCTKVSAGCDNCYAERITNEGGDNFWGPDARRLFTSDRYWSKPLDWNRTAREAGQRRQVFCSSMSDWAEGRPDQTRSRERLWQLIPRTPWLDWLLLTKRPQAIPALYPTAWQQNPAPNVWLGTSVENQYWLDNRWGHLREVPAVVHFLSVEPLLEQVALPDDFLARGKQAWCIVGGESGEAARPMSPNWVRRLRDQCVEAGVPFHFKQWGEWAPDDPHGGRQRNQFASRVVIEDHPMVKLGKDAAGHVLDGVVIQEFPTPGVDLDLPAPRSNSIPYIDAEPIGGAQ